MRAQAGDWLVVEGRAVGGVIRRGLIEEVHGKDGAPPYLVHWADTGHRALTFPGPDAHVRGAGADMTTAADVMHTGVHTISDGDSVAEAARRMRDLGIGALPVCDAAGHPHGILTDRDIVVECLAAGKDPGGITVGSIVRGELLTVDPDCPVTRMLTLMQRHRIRRLPVVEDGRLIGIVTEGDLALHLPDRSVGEFVEGVCEP